MTKSDESILRRLLDTCASTEESGALLGMVNVSPSIGERVGDDVPRAVVAQALNLLLLRDLLARVPTGRNYVQDVVARGRRIVFDHGALRTVALRGMGALPAGEEAVTRILLPLGYRVNSVYPLDRLGMTGRSYTHLDFPEDLPQFFLSELHPERFSPAFQSAVQRVTASSRDPLTDAAKRALQEMSANGALPFDEVAALLPVLVTCFQRQHANPTWSDYETLRAESAEMAWIATEGNVFNHATDRVASLDEVVTEQRKLNRPMKDNIEVSRSGRVRQTAFRADPVEREFVAADGGVIHRSVPGSFYEFIQREMMRDAVTGNWRLDLAFDSSNAQGIFKMTAAA